MKAAVILGPEGSRLALGQTQVTSFLKSGNQFRSLRRLSSEPEASPPVGLQEEGGGVDKLRTADSFGHHH